MEKKSTFEGKSVKGIANYYLTHTQENRAITLISLVITIIILLILAGVTINMTIGENGIFGLAENAGEQYKKAEIKEQIGTEIIVKQAENNGNITDNTLKEILEKYGTLSEEEEELKDKTLTTTNGNYKIKVSDIFKGTITKVANAPDISGFNKENTYYVEWNLNEAGTEYIINEVNMKEVEEKQKTIPNNWYNYTAGTNKWANIKTTGGGNECYWVWIPRYAYKITEGYHTNEAGTIEIKFLKGTTNEPLDGSNIEISNSSGAGNWNVHPAFTR